MFVGAIAVIAVAVMLWAAHYEWEWAQTLRRLQRDGRQVRALQVHVNQSARPRGNYVTYRFRPPEWEEQERRRQPRASATTPSTAPATAEEVMALLKEVDGMGLGRSRPPNDVTSGHRLSRRVRESDEFRDSIVTYLPDVPGVSAIGKLDDERVTSEWRGNPVFVVVPVWLLIVLLLVSVAHVWRRKKLRRAPE